ncbi:hypothetical protein, partial [Klebsiella pneumoniae]|uniref:hypothetical protein n=1 Tax=Klebsiella pneumoniae TaxID=573 RepID=UPI0040554590
SQFIENYKPDTLSVIKIGKMDDSKYNMIKFINSHESKKRNSKKRVLVEKKKSQKKIKKLNPVKRCVAEEVVDGLCVLLRRSPTLSARP